MKQKKKTQKGMTFVAAVFTLLLFSILAAAFASLLRRQAFSVSHFTADEQMLFISDSGMEMAINWFYQDDATRYFWWDNADPLDRSRLLPFYQNVSLGGGTISIFCEYAATTLTSDIGAVDTTIEVNSTTGFPDSGIILINTEWIQYFAKTDTEFLSCIRGHGVSDPNDHTGGTFVYPACQLTAGITAADTIIPVTSTEKFLPTGTVFINNEAIRYKSKNATQFLDCIRGSFDTTALPHVQNEKVFPASFEAVITSSAQKDGREKTVEVLLQYQYGTKWK